LKLGALVFLVFVWFVSKDFKDARHPIKLFELFLVTGGAAFIGLMAAGIAANAIRAFEGDDVVWSEPDEDGHHVMLFDNETYYNVDGTPMVGGMGGFDLNGNAYGQTHNDD